MKVYKVDLEVNDYQSLLAKDNKIYKTRLLSFDGSSKNGQWKSPLEAVLDNKRGLIPDIYSFGAGNLLIPSRFTDILKSKLTNAEFLPVFWSEEDGFIVNVVGYSDCLDIEATEWCCDDDSGKKLFIEKHEFEKNKVPDNFLFKIEEDCFEIFCVDKEDGSENFKSFIEEKGLKGVGFEIVWED